MLIRSVELAGAGVVDVRVVGGRIAEIGAVGEQLPGAADVDGRGAALLPGLHDHHVHLTALAAQAASVRVGPADVGDRAGLAAALRAGPPGEWVRAVGYHESVAGDLDRWTLDALVSDRPVRVQHRTGELWVWNTAALHAAGLEGDGRFWREDARLRAWTPPVPLDLPGLGRRAAALGVTGLTNADPSPAPGLSELLAVLPQRVVIMGIDGPVKMLLDDSTLPPPTELAATIGAVRPRPVAVHCVTRIQLLVLLLALDEVGAMPGDRIEHGSVIPAETVPWIARHGLTVVTQPHFMVERGREYATDVAPDDREHLYRCRSLAEAGVPLAAGTDAPFGGFNPWAAMRAAVGRDDVSEALEPADALSLFTGAADAPGTPRRLDVGSTADFCLLHTPLREASETLTGDLVRATFIGGRAVAGDA
ncbi:amidohydrolase family protein [Yinghuangia sp. YIM S09857]|uniref:amidohydrolase family protein n=1 Tax=Yinghuangia sp. YIM S09857 TaxID=3436929 RepID=UPI003F52A571